MAGATLEISYHFICAKEHRKEIPIRVVLDAATLNQVRPATDCPPEWTRLSVCQCPNCRLDPRQHAHCPVALSLVQLVEHFDELSSHTEVEIIVVTDERTVFQKTTIQKALRSLMGLLMATSGCPALDKMKPMARFHLPFATREETVFRAASAYLLAQYFLARRGKPFDTSLDGLRSIYDEMHAVNIALANRLRRISVSDANVNAVVLLDVFAQDLPFSIKENLADIEPLFLPYFESPDRPSD